MTITTRDKLSCVAREIRQRYGVYAKRVARGSMSAQEKTWEIAVMEAIAEDYARLLAEEEREDDDGC